MQLQCYCERKATAHVNYDAGNALWSGCKCEYDAIKIPFQTNYISAYYSVFFCWSNKKMSSSLIKVWLNYDLRGNDSWMRGKEEAEEHECLSESNPITSSSPLRSGSRLKERRVIRTEAGRARDG